MSLDLNFVVKITTDCPGKCPCCVNRQKNFLIKGKNEGPFDINGFKNVCKNVRDLGGEYVALSGGEPTVVRNFDEYISIAHQHGLAVRVNTNGWNITQERLRNWHNQGLDQVVVSLYGMDEETVRKTRGNPRLFNRSFEAVKALGEFKEEHDFIYIVQSTIMKQNYEQIPQILTFAIDNKADIFWPSYLEDSVNLESLRMGAKEVNKFRSVVIPRMKEIIVQRFANAQHQSELLDNVSRIYSEYFADGVYHNREYKCSLPGRHVTFYPNGILDPCPGHEYFKSGHQKKIDYVPLGNLFIRDFMARNKNLSFEYCKHCPQGQHVELRLVGKKFHEHSRKENK